MLEPPIVVVPTSYEPAGRPLPRTSPLRRKAATTHVPRFNTPLDRQRLWCLVKRVKVVGSSCSVWGRPGHCGPNLFFCTAANNRGGRHCTCAASASPVLACFLSLHA
eukprot:365126-Chlamydomonas_euryale.AAC.25